MGDVERGWKRLFCSNRIRGSVFAAFAEAEEDEEYCGRLREVNEDEHDLRSGRVLGEFELPGPQDYETTPSLSTWDTLFYTRNHPSINTERQRRHLSKLLTYPMSVASVMHRMGPFGTGRGSGNSEAGRVTREGSRSLSALHTSLHPALGSPPSPTSRNTLTPIRIFILGARAESALPPHVWEQICHLFPFTRFQMYFVGPQAALPMKAGGAGVLSTGQEQGQGQGQEHMEEGRDGKKVYDEVTPVQNSETQGLRGRNESVQWGVPSYTVPVSPYLTLTTLQTPYEKIHEQFGPFDPYTDVFFTFCPGFGFPSPSAGREAKNPDGSQVIQAQLEWKEVLQQVLSTKCAMFITGFSPRDVERDVKSLDTVEGVKGEHDILITAGENRFASLKWEAGDFDPRVMVRVNWGVWGIRGKRYEVQAGKE